MLRDDMTVAGGDENDSAGRATEDKAFTRCREWGLTYAETDTLLNTTAPDSITRLRKLLLGSNLRTQVAARWSAE